MSRKLLEISTDYYLSDPSGNGKLTELISEALKRKPVEERQMLNENADQFIDALGEVVQRNPYADRIAIHLGDK